MRKANLTEFRNLVYTPESAPTLATLRTRINRHEIPGGKKEGGCYYVDLDVYFKGAATASENAARLAELRADPELQGLL